MVPAFHFWRSVLHIGYLLMCVFLCVPFFDAFPLVHRLHTCVAEIRVVLSLCLSLVVVELICCAAVFCLSLKLCRARRFSRYKHAVVLQGLIPSHPPGWREFSPTQVLVLLAAGRGLLARISSARGYATTTRRVLLRVCWYVCCFVTLRELASSSWGTFPA